MRKLYKYVFLIMIPIAFYIVFFFANDPHGYFSGASSDAHTLIDNMLSFRNGDYSGILLGDSRLPDFNREDVAKLDSLTGLKYLNMSYPGASAEEMNRLFQWCEQEKPGTVQSVIIVTGWYNFNRVMRADRVTTTVREIESPLIYAFSPDNLFDCFSSLFSPQQDEPPSPISDEQKALNFQTHLENVDFYLNLFEFDQEILDDLIKVCKYCNEHHIAVKIVLPPWWHSFYTQLESHDLDKTLDDYKMRLSCYAPVYDLEYKDCALSFRYEDYSDNSHFHGKTYDDFCDVILHSSLDYARLWEGGKLV